MVSKVHNLVDVDVLDAEDDGWSGAGVVVAGKCASRVLPHKVNPKLYSPPSVASHALRGQSQQEQETRGPNSKRDGMCS